MNAGFTVGRVRGIEISIHWSWLVVFALVAWTLADSVFPEQSPGLSDGAYIAMALTATVAFFVALLLHELGHAFQARREGMRIEGITLWLFGGVARFSGQFPGAAAELRVALAGPLVTAAITVVLGALTPLPLPEAVDGVITWLGVINLVLLVFNLVPALPLDGGRVLHAVLWRSRGDLARATLVAAAVGRGFGYVLIGSGAALFVGGAPGSGVWLVFLGWFLLQAATAESRDVLLRDALGDLRVGDLMVRHPVTADAAQTLAAFMDEVAHVHRYTAYPVVDDGTAVGLLAFGRVAATPRRLWEQEHVGDCMARRGDVPDLDPRMALLDALGVMQAHGVDRALVVEGDALAGLLSITDVGRVVSESTAMRAQSPWRRSPT